jgi:hypothetical protein
VSEASNIASTPERILNSQRMRVFMEWFQLFAFAVWLLILLAIVVGFFVGLTWWLA